MNYSLALIVPNFNGKKLLAANLPLVLTEVRKFPVRVLVADDASTDGSAEFVRQKFPKIEVLTSTKCKGFARNVNFAVSQVRADIVILLNHDVYPQSNFLTPLVKHFANESVFAVGCLEKEYKNGIEINKGRGIGIFKSGFLVHAAGSTNKDSTLWIQGGSGAFRRTIWNELGGFDPIYAPFYYEDIDLSYRALKAGYAIVFEPSSIVVHEHEKGAIRRHYGNMYIKTVAYRNQHIFIWKNISSAKLFSSHLFWLPYHFISSILAGDFAYLVGFFWALLFAPILIYKRLKLPKEVHTDENIVKKFAAEMII